MNEPEGQPAFLHAEAFSQRLEQLRDRLHQLRLDGFLVSHPPNLRYLFNFSGSEGLGLILDDQVSLLVDSRYLEQAREEVFNSAVVPVKVRGAQGLAGLLSTGSSTSSTPARVGFEAGAVSFRFHSELASRLPGLNWVPTDHLLEELRMIKQPEEIEILRRAFRITRDSLAFVQTSIQPGVTELEVVGMLEQEVRRYGGEGMAFDTIVLFGPRSSLPHGRPSTRRLQPGEIVLLDFGVRCHGYNSDITRMLALPGTPKPPVFDVVFEAQSRALQAIRPGVPSTEVDRAARELIAKEGFADYFGHSTGHGIGLEVHELPLISWRSGRPLEEQMVFTIEPGIYLPGRGGVRIEDTVVVRPDGVELLSQRCSWPGGEAG